MPATAVLLAPSLCGYLQAVLQCMVARHRPWPCMLTCGLWARQADQAHVSVCLPPSQPCNKVELASAGNTCTQLTLVSDAGCDSYGGCLAHARLAMLCYMQPFIDGCSITGGTPGYHYLRMNGATACTMTADAAHMLASHSCVVRSPLSLIVYLITAQSSQCCPVDPTLYAASVMPSWSWFLNHSSEHISS